MSDDVRMVVSRGKDDKWRAYYKKSKKTEDGWVSDSRERLWTKVKESLGANKHYTRRSEWIVSWREENVTKDN